MANKHEGDEGGYRDVESKGAGGGEEGGAEGGLEIAGENDKKRGKMWIR